MEIPDFGQIVQPLIEKLSDTMDPDNAREMVVEQLRQVWNLRGAADCRAIDTRLSALTGWVTSEPYRKQLREAIEAADVPGP